MQHTDAISFKTGRAGVAVLLVRAPGSVCLVFRLGSVCPPVGSLSFSRPSLLLLGNALTCSRLKHRPLSWPPSSCVITNWRGPLSPGSAASSTCCLQNRGTVVLVEITTFSSRLVVAFLFFPTQTHASSFGVRERRFWPSDCHVRETQERSSPHPRTSPCDSRQAERTQSMPSGGFWPLSLPGPVMNRRALPHAPLPDNSKCFSPASPSEAVSVCPGQWGDRSARRSPSAVHLTPPRRRLSGHSAGAPPSGSGPRLGLLPPPHGPMRAAAPHRLALKVREDVGEMGCGRFSGGGGCERAPLSFWGCKKCAFF